MRWRDTIRHTGRTSGGLDQVSLGILEGATKSLPFCVQCLHYDFAITEKCPAIMKFSFPFHFALDT
ncbi:hypothetical protein SBDP1_40039 [Syntrophobacter sp. SbD1]|nr:hypothetical protein SBDP1_40039 [Syntrophobacter sp. SbD1]